MYIINIIYTYMYYYIWQLLIFNLHIYVIISITYTIFFAWHSYCSILVQRLYKFISGGHYHELG